MSAGSDPKSAKRASSLNALSAPSRSAGDTKTDAKPPLTSAAAAGTSPVKVAPAGTSSADSDGALEAKLDAMLASRLDALLSKKLATLSALSALPKPGGRKVTSSNRTLSALRAAAGEEDDEAEDSDATDPIVDGDLEATESAAAPPTSSRTPSGKQQRIASAILDRCSQYGSVLSWVKVTEWRNTRNKHECEAIAQALDAMLAEGIRSTSLSMEILLRRLSGVHLADTTGEWKACDAVVWNSTGNSLLPRDEVKRALKDAETMKRLYSSGSNSSSKRAFGSNRGEGGAGRSHQKQNRNQFKKDASASGNAQSAERKSAAADK